MSMNQKKTAKKVTKKKKSTRKRKAVAETKVAEIIEPETHSHEETVSKVVTPEVIEPNLEISGSVSEPVDPLQSLVVPQETGLTTTDPIALYLQEIRQYPLLSKEDEFELAVKYKETGDREAAQKLITSNLRFVVKVATDYSKFGAKLIDLVQEGNIGLMQALKEFNPYKGVRLITYAVWWIRGHIQEYLMRQYSMVRIGTTQSQKKLFYQLQKQKAELESMGMGSDVKLLAGRLNVSEADVRMMSQRMSGRDVSLDQPLSNNESSSSTLIDLQTTPDEGNIEDDLSTLEQLEILKDKIDELRPTLNEREILLLEKRILADEPVTLQEIGNEYNITREAVRQLEARLMKKIKNLFLEHSE